MKAIRDVSRHYSILIFRSFARVLTFTVTSPVCVFLVFLYLMYITKAGHGPSIPKVEHQDLSYSDDYDVDSPIVTENDEIITNETGDRAEHFIYERRMARLRPVKKEDDDFLYLVDAVCRLLKPEPSTRDLPTCPCVPPTICGRLPMPSSAPSWDEITERYTQLSLGGRWKPRECQARERTIIVIPMRDRERHLQMLLYHTHAVWQQQQLDYTVYVAEQTAEGPFNKALMMNAAYREAMLRHDFDCVIFHDVDLLIEDGRSLYRCGDQPRHLGVSIDKYMYTLIYPELIGGVLALTRKQFEKVNGFSNRFFGWGGEDDNFYSRLTDKNYKIDRYPPDVPRYKMMPHPSDKGNPANKHREVFVNQVNISEDGFRTSQYNVVKIEERPLYTHILVEPVCTMTGLIRKGQLNTTDEIHNVALPGCKKLCQRSQKCIGVSHSPQRCSLHFRQGALLHIDTDNAIYISKECYGVSQTKLPEVKDALAKN